MIPPVPDDVKRYRSDYVAPRLLGPECRMCRAHEARCARNGGCCEACTHTFGEDTNPCGTPAAYWRHLARNEPACPACRKAAAAYERDRKRKKAA